MALTPSPLDVSSWRVDHDPVAAPGAVARTSAAWQRLRADRRRGQAPRSSPRPAAPTVSDPARAAFGIIIRADGSHHLLHDPVGARDLALILDPVVGSVVARHPHHPEFPLVLHVDASSHGCRRRPNAIATALSGTCWPVFGDVIVTAAGDTALSSAVVDDIVTTRTLVSTRSPA